MSCYHPLTAYRMDDGSVSFRETGRTHSTLSIPCGQCIGCRLRRAREWSVRVMHEASMYDGRNSFVTLTYDDEHLPRGGGLHYPHVQAFFKRLRHQYPFRFFMCGEYGEELKRPHYHVGFFGVDFAEDRRFLRKAGEYSVWRSPKLESLWHFGRSEIGSLTEQSAGYIARYVLAKLNGEAGKNEYRRFDAETGEVYQVVPPFCRMSLKPGIGARWFEKFGKDVFPRDGVIVNGRKLRVPRYYDNKMGDELKMEEIKYDRYVAALAHRDDTTDERLSVREQVDLARVGLTRRE